MPVKTPAMSSSYIAEIVGQESLLGRRLSAGTLLQMMDMAAAAAALKHADSAVVTLAFDRIELLNMVCHMDLVKFDATVIKVGRSSLLVHVVGHNKMPTDMDWHETHSGFITMVAIDQDHRPNRNIPGLEYPTEADQACQALAQRRDAQGQQRKAAIAAIEQMTTITAEDLREISPRRVHLAPVQTDLTIRKLFLPKHTNALGVVFGGDTIQLMEELAVACARQFTGNFNCVTIAMEDVLFLQPLHLNQLVEMASRVIFVGQTTLVVQVIVRAYTLATDAWQETNRGTFTVLNYDRGGRKQWIPTDLDLSQATLEDKQAYLREQWKYDQAHRART